MKEVNVFLFIFFCCMIPAIFATTADAEELGGSSDVSNEFCLGCHSNPGMSSMLPSGETLPLGVDKQYFDNSIHGRVGIGCTKCHFDHSTFPHPALPAGIDHREYTTQKNEACGFCHTDVAEQLKGNAHELSREAGMVQAAVCSDCHGAHDTKSLDELKPVASQTCRHCHSEIFDLYAESVHGEALLAEGNTEVPNCIDCHQAHHIVGPKNSGFHLFSPDICGNCHSDKGLMAKYGINTDVMNSWVYDFHGKTVKLYQETQPTEQTDKAVCVDCHGVHDIRRPDDPGSTVMKENLLRTCKKCHPTATANFPSAWMGHYRPDVHKYPLVFFVTWFYRLAIPGIIGGMFVFVVSDYFRTRIDKRKGKLHG